MFDDLVVSSANPQRTNKPWTVALSFLIQFGIVIVMILIPLIYTEALPKQMLTTFLVAPPPPPPPPPPRGSDSKSGEAGCALDSQRPDDRPHCDSQKSCDD